MATYLSLCQQLHRLIRAGNNIPGSLPSTVVGQTDPLLSDIVYFVNEAWNQIQHEHPEWVWMQKQATLLLPIGSNLLTITTIKLAASDWQEWRPMMAAQYRYSLLFDPNNNPVTQLPLYFLPWAEFHGFFDRLPRTTGQPIRFSQDPAFNLVFDPPCAAAPSGAAYNMICNYRTVSQALAADADVPNMPEAFHNLIVYWAGMLYCQTRSATSALLSSCTANMTRILEKLRAEQLPELVIDSRFV